MLFNSYEFILLFLPISLAVYFLLNKLRLTLVSKAWLVATSLFFYSWWNIIYLPLILGSIFFNYVTGTALTGLVGQKRTAALVIGIISNIALLGYFKYTDFFITNINMLTGSHFDILKIVLPLGISFFTFTQIAYLVDAYRSEAKEYSLLNYSLFVTFFPHLLAGPIIHHKEMMPQFDSARNKLLNYRNLSVGLYLFFIGLAKKVIVADTFAAWANTGFGSAASLTFIDSWVTSLSYTIQLYFDFSGYTDMALGSSLMFNIKLPVNFNSPYKAINIQDFWRRWHITLSRFLRDYVYIPLGGNRANEPKVMSNLLITFLIGGLWHGAGWTFVIWGLLHGTAIVVNRLWKNMDLSMPRALAWFLTFNFVNAAWIFFRAENLGDAASILKGMIGLNGIVLDLKGLGGLPVHINQAGMLWGTISYFLFNTTNSLVLISAALLVILLVKNSNDMRDNFQPRLSTTVYTATLAALCLVGVLFSNTSSEFLYFNF